MVLLAVLPGGLVAAVGAVAAWLVYARVVTRSDTAALWWLFGGTFLVVCAVFITAGLLAAAQAQRMRRRYAELSLLLTHSQAELAELLQQVREGQCLEQRRLSASPLPESAGDDALDRLGHEIANARRAAEAAVLEIAAEARGGETIEVFSNLARRLESLVHREIGLLDDLENEVEDPDLLKRLFAVDHLATRIRRYAENLAVLGGAVPHRQWTRPISMADVMRSAIAEVEQYTRVKFVPPVEGTVAGHAVVDVVHLLAELIENATVFSPPQTKVLLRSEFVTAGLAIEVEDRGLGMTAEERKRMNSLLTSPDRVVLGELLQDGRIGLYVVSSLARRHNIAVELQRNIYGGTQAVVVLPHELLGTHSKAPESEAEPAERKETAADHSPATAARAEQHPVQPSAPEKEQLPAGIAADAESPTGRTAVQEAVRQAVPAAPARPTASTVPAGDRPALPKRRRQEPACPVARPLPSAAPPEEVEHNPGLMAAFQKGIRLAGEARKTDTANRTDKTDRTDKKDESAATAHGREEKTDPAP